MWNDTHLAKSRPRLLLSLSLAVILGSPLAADEPNDVRIDVAHLAGPTEWCEDTEGVPTVVRIDGPAVFTQKPIGDGKGLVAVRKGGEEREIVDVSRVDVGQFRIGRGVDRREQQRLYPREDELELAGRLIARADVCLSIRGSRHHSAQWKVVNVDGQVAYSGETRWLELASIISGLGRYPQPVVLEGQTFVVYEPTVTQTTEAFASPAEEQSK